MCAPALGIIPALGSSTASAQGLGNFSFKTRAALLVVSMGFGSTSSQDLLSTGLASSVWNLDLRIMGAEPVLSLSARGNHKKGAESSSK